MRYELLLPGPEEDAEAIEAVLPGEAPADYVQRVTALKLDAAVVRHAQRRLALGTHPVLRHHGGVGLAHLWQARGCAGCRAHAGRAGGA